MKNQDVINNLRITDLFPDMEMERIAELLAEYSPVSCQCCTLGLKGGCASQCSETTCAAYISDWLKRVTNVDDLKPLLSASGCSNCSSKTLGCEKYCERSLVYWTTPHSSPTAVGKESGWKK